MAWQFLVIALIQIVVGSLVYFCTDGDIQRVENMAYLSNEKNKSKKTPGMKVVMKNLNSTCPLGFPLNFQV